MDKKTIRKTFLQKRMNLSESAIESAASSILLNFQEIRFESLEHILSYRAIVNRNEFNVADSENHLQSLFPTCSVCWPKINPIDFTISAHKISAETQFETNQYGIAEPVNGEFITPELIDLIFVPLIAFDKKGYRVGYGKGYYDRFLPNCKPDVLSIGFSFFEALDQIEGLDEFDVPLKFCISPTRIYEF